MDPSFVSASGALGGGVRWFVQGVDNCTIGLLNEEAARIAESASARFFDDERDGRGGPPPRFVEAPSSGLTKFLVSDRPGNVTKISRWCLIDAATQTLSVTVTMQGENGDSCGESKEESETGGEVSANEGDKEVVELCLIRRSPHIVPLPKSWEFSESPASTGGSRRLQLRLLKTYRQNVEGLRVLSLIHSGALGSSSAVHGVFRIQNQHLWERWCAERVQLRQARGETGGRVQSLWYGTNRSHPWSVYGTAEGIDPRFSSRSWDRTSGRVVGGFYGEGVYFAENIAYSAEGYGFRTNVDVVEEGAEKTLMSWDQLTYEPNGRFILVILAKVLLGLNKDYGQEVNRDLRLPPLIEDEERKPRSSSRELMTGEADPALEHLRYDSVSGGPHAIRTPEGKAIESRFSVVYDNRKAFPAYLLVIDTQKKERRVEAKQDEVLR